MKLPEGWLRSPAISTVFSRDLNVHLSLKANHARASGWPYRIGRALLTIWRSRLVPKPDIKHLRTVLPPQKVPFSLNVAPSGLVSRGQKPGGGGTVLRRAPGPFPTAPTLPYAYI